MSHIMPQQAPHGKGREIAALVAQDVLNKAEEGCKKYGEPLKAFNGRNPLIDAYQEAIDLAKYLKQAIIEHEEQERMLAVLDGYGIDSVEALLMALSKVRNAEIATA